MYLNSNIPNKNHGAARHGETGASDWRRGGARRDKAEARRSGGAVGDQRRGGERGGKLVAASALFSCVLVGADESHGKRGTRRRDQHGCPLHLRQ